MSGERRHLFLSGPMGAGKSTVGILLARRLGRPFVDLDDEVERAASLSIAEIFAAEGEAGFRQREQRALDAVFRRSPSVVALGGGTVVDPETRRKLRSRGQLVTLTASAPALKARLEGDLARPLLAELDELLAAREGAYADSDRVVSTEGMSPAEVTEVLLAAIGHREALVVALGSRAHPVIVTHRAEVEASERIADLATTGRALLITDEAVHRLHGRRLVDGLQARGVRVSALTVAEGEASKSLETLGNLYNRALAEGVDRQTLVVALGGGVVGDLAGFLAATLLRGLPWVQLPTTLLAQVDSSVGGKTGINHAQGKNLIGAFHQPALVFADTAWLATLPPRELRAGMAEVVKHAAVADPALLALVPPAMVAVSEGRFEALVPLVASAIRVKAAIVAEDEHDHGRRTVLNFGHTLAHAIEGAHPGALRHGEAVALGIACDAERSLGHGLTRAECARLTDVLAAVGLDLNWRAWVTPEVLDMVAKDKKIRRECLDDVLLRGLGRPVVESVPIAAWRQALARASVTEEA